MSAPKLKVSVAPDTPSRSLKKRVFPSMQDLMKRRDGSTTFGSGNNLKKPGSHMTSVTAMIHEHEDTVDDAPKRRSSERSTTSSRHRKRHNSDEDKSPSGDKHGDGGSDSDDGKRSHRSSRSRSRSRHRRHHSHSRHRDGRSRSRHRSSSRHGHHHRSSRHRSRSRGRKEDEEDSDGKEGAPPPPPAAEPSDSGKGQSDSDRATLKAAAKWSSNMALKVPTAKAAAMGGSVRSVQSTARRPVHMEMLDSSNRTMKPGFPSMQQQKTMDADEARLDHSFNENDEEFRFLDYTPVTVVRPIDLEDELKVSSMGRQVKLAIVVTMYTEEGDELERTLKGIAACVREMRDCISWKEILVCIVMDGMQKVHPSTLEYCDKIGIFRENTLVQEANGMPTTVHLFERTRRLSKFDASNAFYDPLQLLLALKVANGGKLNSHLWFMSGFCRQVQPDYVLLVDVGTVPSPQSIGMLFRSMEENEQVGGCCGEIVVRNPRWYHVLSATQMFEYKISHIMDKAMESVFGYITVLPGAFSMYRWIAIIGEPLDHYFTVEETSLHELGPFVANMFLAEDRVLCFEVAFKAGKDWTLHFVSGATAVTDTPLSLVDLIKQRRRWLNGAFFSLVYYLANMKSRIWQSNHSIWRILAFFIQFIYLIVSLAFNWLSLGTLHLMLILVFESVMIDFSGKQAFLFVIGTVYFGLLLLQVLVGLNTKPHRAQQVHMFCAFGFGLIMTAATTASVYMLVTQQFSLEVILVAVSSFGSYIVAGLMHGQVVQLLLCAPSYLFMIPANVNMLTTYSFCNLHDISWGTKEGSVANALQTTVKTPSGINAKQAKFLRKIMNLRGHDTQVAEKQAELISQQENASHEFNAFRTRFLGLWLMTNLLLIHAVEQFELTAWFGVFIGGAVLFVLAYRLTGSLWYMVELLAKWIIKACCGHTCRCRCCKSGKVIKRRLREMRVHRNRNDVLDEELVDINLSDVAEVARAARWFTQNNLDFGRKHVLQQDVRTNELRMGSGVKSYATRSMRLLQASNSFTVPKLRASRSKNLDLSEGISSPVDTVLSPAHTLMSPAHGLGVPFMRSRVGHASHAINFMPPVKEATLESHSSSRTPTVAKMSSPIIQGAVVPPTGPPPETSMVVPVNIGLLSPGSHMIYGAQEEPVAEVKQASADPARQQGTPDTSSLHSKGSNSSMSAAVKAAGPPPFTISEHGSTSSMAQARSRQSQSGGSHRSGSAQQVKAGAGQEQNGDSFEALPGTASLPTPKNQAGQLQVITSVHNPTPPASRPPPRKQARQSVASNASSVHEFSLADLASPAAASPAPSSGPEGAPGDGSTPVQFDINHAGNGMAVTSGTSLVMQAMSDQSHSEAAMAARGARPIEARGAVDIAQQQQGGEVVVTSSSSSAGQSTPAQHSGGEAGSGSGQGSVVQVSSHTHTLGVKHTRTSIMTQPAAAAPEPEPAYVAPAFSLNPDDQKHMMMRGTSSIFDDEPTTKAMAARHLGPATAKEDIGTPTAYNDYLRTYQARKGKTPRHAPITMRSPLAATTFMRRIQRVAAPTPIAAKMERVLVPKPIPLVAEEAMRIADEFDSEAERLHAALAREHERQTLQLAAKLARFRMQRSQSGRLEEFRKADMSTMAADAMSRTSGASANGSSPVRRMRRKSFSDKTLTRNAFGSVTSAIHAARMAHAKLDAAHAQAPPGSILSPTASEHR